jgi:hypothetical protein
VDLLSGKFLPDEVCQSFTSVKQTYIIGALNRAAFRRSLLASDIKFEEDRGFLDSQFIVTATPHQYSLISVYIRRRAYEMEFSFFTFKVPNKLSEIFYSQALAFVNQENITISRGWLNSKYEIWIHPTMSIKLSNYLMEIKSSHRK